ncbi:retrovirus-related pol polyprotein from transposon TNT 1-94, partial [Tanacetum coccineum]
LTIPVFKHDDDPIDAINHVMSFLSAVVSFCYPTTNNQLRNSSNLRQQATINYGRVTVQPVQGRQISYVVGTTITFTPGVSGNNLEKQRFVTCYNCKGEGRMSKQCAKPRRKRDPEIPKGQATQTVITHNVVYQADDLDAYDSDCDELNTAKVALLANLYHYGSDALAKVHNHDNVNNNMINQVMQVISSSEQSNVVNHSETEITSNRNIIPYSQYVIESQQAAVQNLNSSAQQDALILSVIKQLKTQVTNCTKINLENKSVNDTLNAELERYKEQVKVLKEGQNVDLKSQDNVSKSCAQSVEIDHIKRTLSKHLKEKESLLKTVTLLKNDFKKEESRNLDREIALEKHIKHLDIIFLNEQSATNCFHMLTTNLQFFYDNTSKALGFQFLSILKKAQQLEPMLYVGDIIQKTNPIMIPDLEETLTLAEESRVKPSNWFLAESQPSGTTKKDKILPNTKITTTTEAPLRKPIVLDNETSKPVVTLVYSRKLYGTLRTNVPVAKLWSSKSVLWILGYGGYQIGNVTISRVYYVEGLGHNLFSVRQFWDSNLEVAFRQHTYFIHNLESDDLLIGSRGNNLYTLSLGYMMASSPICLLSKALKTNSWLWHRRLSHLNFGTITYLARHGLVRCLPKLNFKKDHMCYACAMARSPQQNGVVESQNRTLIEVARTMLIYAKALLFLWAEAVATVCYTQNCSIIRLRHGKTPYELLHEKIPDLSFFYVFGALCYPTNDTENLGKLQPKADIGIFIGYAPTKKAF